MGILSNTGPDPLKNQKATKTAFNVAGHHRHASETLFNDPLGSSHPSSTKKVSELDPSDKLSVSAHVQIRQ